MAFNLQKKKNLFRSKKYNLFYWERTALEIARTGKEDLNLFTTYMSSKNKGGAGGYHLWKSANKKQSALDIALNVQREKVAKNELRIETKAAAKVSAGLCKAERTAIEKMLVGRTKKL